MLLLIFFVFFKQLSCCSIHAGKYDPSTFSKFVGIKLPCYQPNDVQPDEGCEEPIETTWGPARPCRSVFFSNVNVQREQGKSGIITNYSRLSYVNYNNCISKLGNVFSPRTI